MRLYYHPMSSSALRAVVTAAHLGTPVELIVVNLQDPSSRKVLAEVNPNGKVPVLVDGDFTLWESRAIMQYLADLTPGQTIYPTDVRERADVNRWLFFCAQHLSPAAGVLNWENFIKGMIGQGEADAREVARGERMFHACAQVMESQLATRTWLCGETLTLADLSLAAPFQTGPQAKLPMDTYPNVAAWFRRVQALDAWRRSTT